MFDAKEQPLVSVVVLTYNSEKYVLETLESIKNQTYENIELIISDDASTDNTLTLCEKWLKQNKAKFVRVELLTTIKNRGVAPNCNRGYHASKGIWVKFIGGDDRLLPDFIRKNVRFIENNRDVNIIFSDQLLIDEEGKEKGIWKHNPDIMEMSAENQYRELLKGNSLFAAPTNFIQRDLLNDFGGFDERFPMMEDYPLWVNLTKKGIKMHYLPESLVEYRINPDSLWSGHGNGRINPKFIHSIIQFYELVLFNEIRSNKMPSYYLRAKIKNKLNKILLEAPSKYKFYKYLRLFDIHYSKNIIKNRFFKNFFLLLC